MKKAGISLDPRTKFLILIIANMAYFTLFKGSAVFVFIVLGVIICFLLGAYSAAFKFIIFYAVIMTGNVLAGFMPKWLSVIWATFTIAVQFFLPLIIYFMILIYTSTIDDIYGVLEKLRVPQIIAIPILVMIRFIPTIGEEYRYISQAMSLRGLGVGFKNFILHPLKTVEFIYVPLLFSLVRIGEELTMASLTRGLGLYKKRTSMKVIKMRALDYLVLFVYIAVFAWFLLEHNGYVNGSIFFNGFKAGV